MLMTKTVRCRSWTRLLAATLMVACFAASPAVAAPDQPAVREPRIAGHSQTALSLLLSPGAATIGMVLTTMLLARRPKVTTL